ncbi:MAG: KipI antagonist, partial [Bacillota bacterium]
PEIMGSRSTYLRGELGGYEGRKLKKRDQLNAKRKIDKKDFNKKTIKQNDFPDFSQKEIRVIMGPQDDYFTNKGITDFLKEDFKVSSQADRMGYRLKGEEIEHKDGADIISDGIAPGSVQISGDGKAIIMLADRQTTGGYTKIATVISVDLDILSQKKPGDLITFKKVSLSEAHNLLKKREEVYKKLELQKEELSPTKSYKIKVEGEEYEVELQEIL